MDFPTETNKTKSACNVVHKSLLQNTIGRHASQYTVNKQTYIHSLYINTKTYQQINVPHYKYNYISTKRLHVYTKRKRGTYESK